MSDRREEISDAELADELFARERQNEIAIHPAVGARIRAQIEARLGKKRSHSRVLVPAAIAVAAAVTAFILFSERNVEPKLEPLVRAHAKPIEISLAAGKRASLEPESSLIPGEVPEVLAGEVEFRVAKLPQGETFRVRAKDVIVEVIGTVFRVRRDGAEVGVSVEEGAVRIIQGDRDRVLRAGERWSSEDEPRESRAERILRESLERAQSDAPPQDDLHAGTEDPEAARPLAKRSKSVRIDPEIEPKPSQTAIATEPKHATVETPADPKPSEPLARAEQRSLLEQAAAHLRSGEVDAARAIYERLATSDPLGLYLLARLESLHAKRPDAALAALDRFLESAPDHTLAPEARASRIEALLDLEQCARAGALLDEFSTKHPDAGDLIARSKARHRSDCVRSDERSPSSDH